MQRHATVLRVSCYASRYKRSPHTFPARRALVWRCATMCAREEKEGTEGKERRAVLGRISITWFCFRLAACPNATRHPPAQDIALASVFLS